MLSRREDLILRLLAAKEELYGLDMVEASGGLLKRGAIYVILSVMEDKGLLSRRTETAPSPGGVIPRPLYKITEAGRQALAAQEKKP